MARLSNRKRMIREKQKEREHEQQERKRERTRLYEVRRHLFANAKKGEPGDLYRMIQVASELIDDPAYIEASGGEVALYNDLQGEEFAHFGGNPGLRLMVQAYRKNPKLETWKKYQFDIQVMIDFLTPDKERRSVNRTNWKSRAQNLQAKVEDLEDEISQLKAQLREARRFPKKDRHPTESEQ